MNTNKDDNNLNKNNNSYTGKSAKSKESNKSDAPHKRRIHYSGTHPHKFEEKYKELNPEKYADTIEKVISKGSTPAGMHIPIMVNEILDFLQIKPGQTGLDATLGYGGHTMRMLEKLQHQGHLHGLDVDPIESEKTKKRLMDAGFGEDILSVHLMNFADIDKLYEKLECSTDSKNGFDFVLADLGVSSMQIDNPERGFSYKIDGPLDLRLNPEKGIPASERLKKISQAELEGMLISNSDEPYANTISKEIIKALRKCQKIETTSDLREVVEKALTIETSSDKKMTEDERKLLLKKTCQRTFQALRIDVNSEFEVLEEFMQKLPGIMNPGGRIAILTFHSGEDRIVKQYFKYYMKEGIYSQVSKDVVRPSLPECSQNPRAHSTKMRWAIKS